MDAFIHAYFYKMSGVAMGKLIGFIKNYFDEYSQKYSFLSSFIIGLILLIVFIILDTVNFFTPYITLVQPDSRKILMLLFLVLIIFLLFKVKVPKMLIHPVITRLDQVLIIFLILFTVLPVVSFTNYESKTQLLNYAPLFVLVSASVILVRIYCCRIEDSNENSTIFDLKEIMDGEIKPNTPFLVRENAVDYDLLGRKKLTDDFVDLLKNFNSQERFVVGVEGQWGSGKTTFLNSVVKGLRKDSSTIIIDDFEPWIYENKSTLLRNLLDTILTRSQLDVSETEINLFISTIEKNVLGTAGVSTLKQVIDNATEKRARITIQDINRIIKKKNKRIVFIIDNLDRISPENIFLILNVVNNILTFDNLVVILSYDKIELESALNTLNINPQYLNKLVQKRIVFPIIKSANLQDIYNKTIISILNWGNVKFDKEEIYQLTDVLAKNNLGLREFKSYVNSVVIPYAKNPFKISLIDYFSIEFIRIKDLSLCKKIFANQQYFVSVDLGLNSKFSHLDPKKLDLKMTSYFNNFESNYEICEQLLGIIFPNVKVFLTTNENYRSAVDTSRNSSEMRDIQQNKRICSARYFDIYFTSQNNSDGLINDIVDAFIQLVNNAENLSDEIALFFKNLLDLTAENQHKFFLLLLSYVEKIQSKSKSVVAKALITNYLEFKDFSEFFSLDTKNRVASIIELLIVDLEEDATVEILQLLIDSPKNLLLAHNVQYWLNHDYVSETSQFVAYIDSGLEETINNILINRIDLFVKKIYSKGNSLTLMWYLNSKDRSKDFATYLERVLNEENVYRVLNDFVMTGEDSNGFAIYEVSNSFDVFLSEKTVTELLSKSTPSNEKQNLIQDLFNRKFSGLNDNDNEIKLKKSNRIDMSTVD